jgi:hypothetical protein
VRVQGQDDGVTVLDGPPEPLDDVRVDVRAVHLDRGREVEDHRVLWRRPDDVHHGLTDLHREVGLGPREALGRVLVAQHGAVVGQLALVLLAQLGRLDGDVDDAVLVEAEDDPSLEFGDRVVEVDTGPGGTLE